MRGGVQRMRAAAGPGGGADASRVAILLSAFVCPGLGQAVQRRWVAAVLFAGAFVACLAAFMLLAFRIIAGFYRLGFEFPTFQPPPLPLGRWFLAFALSTVVYTVSLADVTRAAQRRRRTAASA